MAESFQQPVTEVTQALRTSTVIQRLARRSTEPSGIVDVRPFQSESTFVPRWIVQRSALLDQIYKRYNSQDNALAEEADLVLAAPSQPVPREQITLPSLEQTAALSSLAIAKPVTQISTSEPSLEQSTAALSSLAITKPVTPTSTSDSSPSGKFRVTRKAIPLPNIKARQEKVQSLQGEIYIQSSKLSNQSPVAGEIASTLHQSQQPEQSLILPNRVSDVASQPPTSNAKNPTFSLQPGMEVNPNEKIPISTEVSQQINPSSQTQNQPTVVPEIGSIQDRNQQTESSLILPSRSRNETSQTSVSAFNSISLSPTEIEQSSFRENSTEQDATQNQLPVAGEIASILHQFPQSEQSLILPKRISETSTTNTENPTFSLQPGMEVNPNEKIPISTEVSQQINPSSQTQNQPTVVPEIGSIQDRNQQTESSLILPSRSRNETSQTSISAFNSISLSPTEIEQSSFRENSTEQDATQNQLPVAGEIASILHQFPKSEQSLILPKRISETSTTNIENPTFSLQPGMEVNPNEKIPISTEVSQQINPSIQTENQLTVVPEITSTLHQFPQSEQSLILPKRISETSTTNIENPTFSLQPGMEVNPNEKIPISTEVSQQINPSIQTQNQPTVVPEIGSIQDRNQQTESSLILPSHSRNETSQTSVSTFNSISLSPTEIEQSSLRENSTQQNATQNQLPVAGEIASTLHQFPQSEQSLILPKRISEISTSNAENPSLSTNILNNSAVAIAREIPTSANFVAEQNMIWRKGDSTTTSEKFFSGVTNSNTQPGMPRAINSGSDRNGYIARTMSTTSSPTSDGVAETELTPVQTSKPVREINVAQIAEQVSRILSRQLTVERERRGMNLWY